MQGLGRAYCYSGQAPKAINYYNQQLEIAREIGNQLAEAQALSGLASAYSSIEQHQAAFNCFRQQLAVAREIKARKEEGQALGALGAYYIFRGGDYRRGIKYCQQALAIALASRTGRLAVKSSSNMVSSDDPSLRQRNASTRVAPLSLKLGC